MGRKVLAAKSGRAACSCAAAGDGIAAKNAKGAKSFSTGFTGLREASVKPAKTKPSGVAWIGDIPEWWEVVPARHIFEEVTAKNKNGQYTRQLSFRYGEIVDKGPNQSHNASPEETILTYTIVEPDTIMINGLNLNYDLLSFRVAIVKEIGIITSAYLAVVPQGSRIIPLYALYLLKAYDFKMVFHGQGSGIRMTLKFADFAALPIVLPPLVEQKAIAAYLDDKCGAIDAAIAEAKKGIEEYKAWKKSLIFEVVTGKRRVGFFNAESQSRRVAEKMKSSGIPWIGDVPMGWEVKRLKYVASCNDDSLAEDTSSDFSFDYVDVGSVKYGLGIVHREPMVFADAPSRARRVVRKDDVIVSTVRTYLKSVAQIPSFNKPIIVSTGFAVLRAKNSDVIFLNYALQSQSFVDEVEARSTGISYPAINASDLVGIKLPLPPLSEQKAIAAYFDEKCAAIDKMVAEKEALIADLEAYKKSLIFEVVTGKREVASNSMVK